MSLSRMLPPAGSITQDALTGLLAHPKTLPAKLLYDDEGCRLFGEITELPEYYLTRTERVLLEEAAPEIGRSTVQHSALVEYGASDEAKASVLLDAMASPAVYVPIDIAESALHQLVLRLAVTRPWLQVLPIAADFLNPVQLPAPILAHPRFGFFPGSTIGNLDPVTAAAFLARARTMLGSGAGFLVGADRRKSPDVLVPAYDDAAGVTAAFNLNLLRRLNREAGADFDLTAFHHHARWNDAEGRIEMHLVSRKEQTVGVGGRRIHFAAGETIHTENSYKHTLKGFGELVRGAGWLVERTWTDPDGLFALYLLRAK